MTRIDKPAGTGLFLNRRIRPKMRTQIKKFQWMQQNMIEWNNYTHILNKILSAVSGLVLVETTFTEILWKHSMNGEELIWIIMYQCICLLHSSIALPSSIYWASLLLLSGIVLLFSFIVKKRNFFFEGWKDLRQPADKSHLHQFDSYSISTVLYC